jgi:hypothetical protein
MLAQPVQRKRKFLFAFSLTPPGLSDIYFLKEGTMTTATITFFKIHQDSQNFGSDDEHMVSRIFFNLEIDGSKYQNLSADIKQTVGADFESGPLEVSPPHGYNGPFNFEAFRREVEDCYRSQVGSRGSGIHIEGGSNIRMKNNIFTFRRVVQFKVKTGSQEGW